MLSEKGARYMETVEAAVVEEDEKYYIVISDGDDQIRIPMSEDKPNNVKAAFNQLILRLKLGKFKIEVVNAHQDLFSQVGKEYIKQLNRELREVYGEMERYGLVEAGPA